MQTIMRAMVGSSLIAPQSHAAEEESALPTGMSRDDLLELYRTMCLSRALDQRIWQLNRQGKAAIAASAQGHEAAQAAIVHASDPTKDHYLIYYRQLTAMLCLGTTPVEMLRQFLARDGEMMSAARQFPLHGSHPRVDVFSFSNVVGTQLPQAVGVALADKMRGMDAVTLAFFGDGAASQGDCHEAMNFDGIHELPVVFLCENNRYAISVPLRLQMPIESVAVRASAYGLPSTEVDGADIVAAYEATKEAVDRARSGDGPSIVELHVERMLPHTTDDDHTRYRSEDEIAGMAQRDPLQLTAETLKRSGLLNEQTNADIHEWARGEVDAATDQVEAESFPPIDAMYRDVVEGEVVQRNRAIA